MCQHLIWWREKKPMLVSHLLNECICSVKVVVGVVVDDLIGWNAKTNRCMEICGRRDLSLKASRREYFECVTSFVKCWNYFLFSSCPCVCACVCILYAINGSNLQSGFRMRVVVKCFVEKSLILSLNFISKCMLPWLLLRRWNVRRRQEGVLP